MLQQSQLEAHDSHHLDSTEDSTYRHVSYKAYLTVELCMSRIKVIDIFRLTPRVYNKNVYGIKYTGNEYNNFKLRLIFVCVVLEHLQRF